MSSKTYSEKLRNPKWQKKRLQVLDRDDFTCVLCGDDQTELHVHHKSYEEGKEPWQYEMENFVTLCKHCHGALTLFKEKHDGTVFKSKKRFHPDRMTCVVMLLVRAYSQQHVALIMIDPDSIFIMAVISDEAIIDIDELIRVNTTSISPL